MIPTRRRRIRPVVVDPATGQQISPLPFVGLSLLVSAAFLYAVAFWMLPTAVALLLLVVWAVMFVLCLRWWTTRPRRTVALGVGALALWFVVVVAGGIGLGWLA